MSVCNRISCTDCTQGTTLTKNNSTLEFGLKAAATAAISALKFSFIYCHIFEYELVRHGTQVEKTLSLLQKQFDHAQNVFFLSIKFIIRNISDVFK